MQRTLRAILILLLGSPFAFVYTANAAEKPNIVYILADDLGWADVSFHGGEIQTPNIDKLAAAGAKLEQFYVQSVCSPTRAAFMTGRYPIRYGLQVGVVFPWAQHGLSLDERILPKALNEAGYTTAITGKWHLGHFEPGYLPTQRGFDHQYGHYNGAIDYFTHHRDGGLDWHRNDRALTEEGYSTKLIATEASRIIEQHDKTKPLFLYVPFNAVHSPHQVPKEYLEPYNHLKGERRTYAGMVAAMDEAIGEIIASLEKKGLRQNTLIAFSSDNGGPNPGVITDNGPLRGSKATLYEGGVRVPAFAVWEGRIKPGSIVNEPIHIVDWYPTFLGLAGVSLDQPLPLDGKDIWATITQGKSSPHDEILLNATPTGGAIRSGNWKLVVDGAREHRSVFGPARRRGGAKSKANPNGDEADKQVPVELFDLANDPGETKDLSKAHPVRVAHLQKRLDEYAKQAAPIKRAVRTPNYKAPAVWGEEQPTR